MDFIKNMLSGSGEVSSMRVLCVGAFIIASLMAFFALGLVYFGKDITQVTILVGMFLGAAIGGKVTQKAIEVNKEQ